MSLKKVFESLAAENPFVSEDADDRWEEYSCDNGSGYTCHHIPRSKATPGEMRFRHTLDGRSELSHSKYYPDSMKGEVNRRAGIKEDAESLNIGDDVIITGPVQFKGKTGVIDSFGRDNRFVVVNLYNHGKHSFHSSDVSFNEYADSDEEADDNGWDNELDESLVESDGDRYRIIFTVPGSLDPELPRKTFVSAHGTDSAAEAFYNQHGSDRRIVSITSADEPCPTGDDGRPLGEGRDEDRGDYEHNIRKQRQIDNPRPKSNYPMDPPETYERDPRMDDAMRAAGQFFNRGSKTVAEGDPDIPMADHKAMKEKERQRFRDEKARYPDKPVRRAEPVAEAGSDYANRRKREEDIISGKKPARKKTPAQTSDYANRRAKEKANESVQNDNPMLVEIKRLAGLK